MLEKICQTKKIIYLRPLDMEMATGGCHENLLMDGKECKKFKSNCNNCPQLNSLNIFNLTKNNLVRKKRIIEKFRPKIFVENSFTKSIFDKSKIFEKVKTKVIFLGINKKRTKFISKYKARKILGIKPTEKVILFGSFNLDSPHKGGEILKDSLKILVSKLDKQKFYKLNFEKIKLITFGRKNKFNINIPKIDWLDLGIILSDRRLNLLYRSADLLVCPSICDNGPHVVTEALTNDLPIVAFNQGVAQDSVINGINGYLVPCFNKFLFSESIYKVLFSKRNNNKSIKIKKIKSFFSSSYEASQIIKHAYSDLKTKNN